MWRCSPAEVESDSPTGLHQGQSLRVTVRHVDSGIFLAYQWVVTSEMNYSQTLVKQIGRNAYRIELN